MIEKKIGKIKSIRFGFGGYQEAMIGVTIDLGSEKDGWGVWDFKGTWGISRSEYAKWTEAERLTALGETAMWVAELLKAANKTSLDQLVGTPVVVTFDGFTMKEWRILTEVL